MIYVPYVDRSHIMQVSKLVGDNNPLKLFLLVFYLSWYMIMDYKCDYFMNVLGRFNNLMINIF